MDAPSKIFLLLLALVGLLNLYFGGLKLVRFFPRLKLLLKIIVFYEYKQCHAHKMCQNLLNRHYVCSQNMIISLEHVQF